MIFICYIFSCKNAYMKLITRLGELHIITDRWLKTIIIDQNGESIPMLSIDQYDFFSPINSKITLSCANKILLAKSRVEDLLELVPILFPCSQLFNNSCSHFFRKACKKLQRHSLCINSQQRHKTNFSVPKCQIFRRGSNERWIW